MKKYDVYYTEKALSQLRKLDKPIARRILDKVAFYLKQSNPLDYAKLLKDTRFGEYRFRIGEYRVIFDVDKKGKIVVLFILAVKHRREVYQGI